MLGGEGYDVETISSGEEALEMAKNKRYGLILCIAKLKKEVSRILTGNR